MNGHAQEAALAALSAASAPDPFRPARRARKGSPVPTELLTAGTAGPDPDIRLIVAATCAQVSDSQAVPPCRSAPIALGCRPRAHPSLRVPCARPRVMGWGARTGAARACGWRAMLKRLPRLGHKALPSPPSVSRASLLDARTIPLPGRCHVEPPGGRCAHAALGRGRRMALQLRIVRPMVARQNAFPPNEDRLTVNGPTTARGDCKVKPERARSRRGGRLQPEVLIG